MSIPSIEHFEMIELDCDDLKRGLAEAARKLSDQLLNRVATDHRKENKAYVFFFFKYILNYLFPMSALYKILAKLLKYKWKMKKYVNLLA